MLSSADRLVVRSGGCCSRCRLPESEEVRVEITDPVKLRSAAQRIRIIEYGGSRNILTCGNPTLEFYAEGSMVASIGVFAAGSISWSQWSTDAELTSESSEAMSAWLGELGFDEQR